MKLSAEVKMWATVNVRNVVLVATIELLLNGQHDYI